jgi:hypothetical protein
MQVARSFAWEFWGRHRWLMGPTLAYLVVLVVLVGILPAGTFGRGIVAELSLPLWTAIPVLIAIFSYGDRGDVLARDSGYPRHAFTLPLRTMSLVAWPLVLGSAVVGGLWLVLAALLQRDWPECPVVWPAVFLATLLAWTQALTWLPFSLPALRLLVAVPVLSAMVAGAILSGTYQLPLNLIITVCIGLFVSGYGLAVWGVARARRGDVSVRSWPVPRLRLPSTIHRAAFRSPMAALAWLEWRSNVLMLPVMVALILPPLLLLAFVSHPQMSPHATLLLPSIVSCPLLFALMAGGSLGNCHSWGRRDSAIPVFLAARPVRSDAIIRVKMRGALLATLATWILMAGGLLAILPLCPLGDLVHQCASALIEALGVGRGVTVLILIVIGLPVLTWKLMVETMWISLIGRYWISVAITVTIPIGITAMTLLFAAARNHPTFADALFASVPWVVWLMFALKLGVGFLIARELRRRDLVQRRSLARFALGWAFGAITLMGLAYWLMPPDVYSPLVVGIAAVVACLPMVRLGLAPLALDWNRHR